MLKRRILLLVFALSFVLLPGCGYCSEAVEYHLTESQISSLQGNLNKLEQNNRELLTILGESNQDLETASSSLTISQQELTALKNQLSESQDQISTLKTQLIELQRETAESKQSLEIANQELQTAIQSCKQLESRQKRIENQRTFWQLVAGSLFVGFLGR